jgi:hypothetical protein
VERRHGHRHAVERERGVLGRHYFEIIAEMIVAGGARETAT